MDRQRTIEAIWRMESARLVASVVRLVRDVGLAEEIVQEVFVVAMESWPTLGLPPNPRAWLLLTARHKAIDLIRREHARDAKYALLANDLRTDPGINTVDTVDDDLFARPDFHRVPSGAAAGVPGRPHATAARWA